MELEYKRLNKPWEKILYLKQTEDDAYVNPNFLREYIDCPKCKLRFRDAFHPSIEVAYIITFLALYLACFYLMYSNKIQERVILSMIIVLGIFMGISYLVVTNFKAARGFYVAFKKTFLMVMCLFIVSPLLKTLQITHADDSIYVTCCILIGFF